MMTIATLIFAAPGGIVYAVEPPDFGAIAIQRATASYTAGDTAAARLQVNAAAARLAIKAGTMKTGGGEVLMLVNDLLLLSIAPDAGNAATLDALGAAERRAVELERRYPDGADIPGNTRR